MKTYKFILAPGIAGVLLSLMVSCKPKPPANERIEYAEAAVLPRYVNLPMAVYTLPKDFRTDSVEFETLLKRAKQLAGDKSELSKNLDVNNEDEIWYRNPTDPSAIIAYNRRNGDFTYDIGVAQYLANRATPGLLKSDKAVEHAREYMKILGFPIKESELKVVHVGGMNMGMYDGNQSTVYEKFTTVRFGRVLDKIPVYGHARIFIQMAEEGTLVKVIRQWTPLERREVKADEMIVAEDLKKRVDQAVLSENADARKIRIGSLELVYYDSGKGIIEPAIRVKGKTVYSKVDKEGKSTTMEYPYDTVVPLLRTPQLRYPFTHGGVKAPSDTDTTDMKENIRRSDDDIKKK